MKLNAQQFAALTRLNNLYGRGNIVEQEPEYDEVTGQGKITLKLQFGTTTATFRLAGNTMFYKRHRMTIPPQRNREKLLESLAHHQIKGMGISGLALPVKLLSSSNPFLTYPCSGVLVILEHGVDLSIVVSVFHRLNKDGTLDAPVEVRNVKFSYDVSIVRS